MLTVDALKKLGSNKFKVLLTIVPPRPAKDADEARTALTEAGLPLFKAEIRRFAAYQKAALAGVPVYQTKAANAKECWADYQAIGKEIISEHKQVQFVGTSQAGTVGTGAAVV